METLLAAPWQMWATLAIIGVTIVFYTLDRFPLELISAGAIIALLFLFLLAPMQVDGVNLLTTETLLSGFASPALFAILGLLIIGQGMFQSGSLEQPTELLLRAFEKRPIIITGAVFVFIMIISAFFEQYAGCCDVHSDHGRDGPAKQNPGGALHDAAFLSIDIRRHDDGHRIVNESFGCRVLSRHDRWRNRVFRVDAHGPDTRGRWHDLYGNSWTLADADPRKSKQRCNVGA